MMTAAEPELQLDHVDSQTAAIELSLHKTDGFHIISTLFICVNSLNYFKKYQNSMTNLSYKLKVLAFVIYLQINTQLRY